MRIKKKLIRVGKVDVRSALGFFWHDKHKIYVVADKDDLNEYKMRGYTDADLYPMSELEYAFRDSSEFRFISWCKMGCIVRQGARSVTFDYTTQKVVLTIK